MCVGGSGRVYQLQVYCGMAGLVVTPCRCSAVVYLETPTWYFGRCVACFGVVALKYVSVYGELVVCNLATNCFQL